MIKADLHLQLLLLLLVVVEVLVVVMLMLLLLLMLRPLLTRMRQSLRRRQTVTESYHRCSRQQRSGTAATMIQKPMIMIQKPMIMMG